MAVTVAGVGIVRNFTWQVRTTDGTSTLIQWCNLAAAGSGVIYNANLYAQQTNAQRAFIQTYVGMANRNSTGVGSGNSIAVGPNGYVDTVTNPWSTFGAPGGWNGVPNDLSASPIVSLQVQGVAATTIDWIFSVKDIFPFGGAVLLVR